jgi:phage tail-like protein
MCKILLELERRELDMSTGIIETKDLIPNVLRQSRDMQALCKILDLLINNYKTNADYWTSLIDFDTCPDSLLPLLASYVGYKYDYSESYDTNRLIIKHYPEMIRNRGSELGISLATALSVNALGEIDKVEALSMFRLDYQKKDKKLYIYIYFPSNLSKVRDLIEVVRPAGCGVQLVASDIIQTIDGIQISDYIGVPQKYAYDHTRYEVSSNSKVAFSEVTNLDDAEL